MLNFDYICMEYGQKIGQIRNDKLETNLGKALGILQEDGVYAMFLWLQEKSKDIRETLVKMLNEKEELKKYFQNGSEKFPEDFREFCEKLKEVAKDIDKLLFMKKILERTLTYALYHAKIGE